MRKYVFGMIIGAALSLAVGVHAEGVVSLINKTIDGQFPVTVNGKKIENQAIVIDGTSYLPVRAIGDALNMDVGFDADLGISLKQKAMPTPPPPTPTIESTPIPSSAAVSQENKIKSLTGMISQKELAINGLKVGLDGRKDDDPVAIEYKKRLIQDEQELTDLQNQLKTLTP